MKGRVNLFLTSIFLFLSVLHFYWLFGGEWGFSSAIPTDFVGNPILKPSTTDTLIVGFGLLFFAIYYLSQTRYSFFNFPRWIAIIFGWTIPFIFLIRSIGDLYYVGFFKEVASTDFGQMDTLLYSPLCLVISIAGFVSVSYKNVR